MECKYCGPENVIKYGKSKGKQCYFCKDCKHKFVDNGTFVKMRTKDKVIVTALDLYFEGLSVRKVQRQIAKIFIVNNIFSVLIQYSLAGEVLTLHKHFSENRSSQPI